MSGTARKLVPMILTVFLFVFLATACCFAQSGGRKTINKPNPTYPELARKMNIKGRVTLKVLIGADGKPRQVTPQGGHPLLVQACTDAVQRWSWEKGTEETRLLEFNFE